jgi:hypothetical protein
MKRKSCIHDVSQIKFKPKNSKSVNKNSWLTTDDINYVLSQISESSINKINMKWMGTHPSDYKSKYKSPKRPLGFVFNTQPGNKPGNHWIGLFVTTDGSTYYFDPNGSKPSIDLIKITRSFSGPHYINTTHIQNEDGDCGIFSIIFLISKMSGCIIQPHEINKFRQKFFTPPKFKIF